MAPVPTDVSAFTAAHQTLRGAQKSAKGAPAYSLYVNRPMGRVLAAAASQAGLTPNQVTALSAISSFAGIGLLATLAPSWPVAIAVCLALVLGYALDAADGQLARLQGSGSLAGEWLDHMVDSAKISSLHLAVAIAMYRHFGLSSGWLLVPMAFTVVANVHFFGMIMVELLSRVQSARSGVPVPPAPSSPLRTLLKTPTDYGVLCLAFALLGWPSLFLAVYTVLAATSAGYLLLVVVKWHRDLRSLGGPQAGAR